MCGRFAFFEDPKVIVEQFQLPELPDIEPNYNITPSAEIGTVGEHPETGNRSFAKLSWGLIPFWADSPDSFRGNLINARAETVHEKNSFKRSFRKRRCII
ncbi:MAG: SOS response-associated peptidase family protein, partial [bacterium]